MSSRKQTSLIILCWAVYTLAYLGRYSYTANIVPIQEYFSISDENLPLLSLPTTFFFFAYGAGQIINGLLCSRYNMKIMLPTVLFLSAAVNISVYFGLPFYLIKYFWLFNGVLQSVLWSSLLLILSKFLDENHMKKAVIFMSTTVSIGTFLAYGFSAGFALFNGFKFSFLVAAVAMSAVAVVWLAFYGKLTEKTASVSEEKAETEEQLLSKPIGNAAGEEKRNVAKGVFLIMLLFGVYAVMINFIKDGLHTWVPNILKSEYGLPDSLSIILTLVLPVFAVFGAASAVFLNKKIKDHSDMVGIFFLLSAACVGGITLFLKTEYWVPLLALFGVVTMFMHGANNVVTSMLPLSVGKKYNAGLIGGLLNGACYIGSTLSQYVIAAIAAASGWTTVFTVLFFACFAPILIAMIWTVIRLAAKKGKIGK